MAVSDTDLSEIQKVLTAEDLAGPVFAELRQRLPKLSWTQCDASDVCEPPFLSFAAFDIHLIDTADHCVQITSDPARATGVILAKKN
ncbi:DUF6129 family protein [Xanthobacter agilis]|jgi:hypothetical protein|uniref:DUF6129 domain-containing protein n=1 Tax=Xanthobacter agilis TaxID=47492 RepID=A0ABU0LDQ1_XANAG|nr:DUF6129 family protein [Xanthobacter agilis]MDQ0505266.1 hypothetical protein [Xanthobacter agilis]